MSQIRYDGMPKESEEHIVNDEINELEMFGYILEMTKEHNLTYNQVKAVMQAETDYLEEKGFIDKPER